MEILQQFLILLFVLGSILRNIVTHLRSNNYRSEQDFIILLFPKSKGENINFKIYIFFPKKSIQKNKIINALIFLR